MSLYEHATELAGLPVTEWEPGGGLPNTGRTAFRLSLPWEAANAGETWHDRFAAFLHEPDVSQVPGLVVGPWGDEFTTTSQPIVEALVAARERLPHLRALFLGDILSEECEISWIRQSDVTPLLEAYPRLEHFQVRGGNGLALGAFRHSNSALPDS